VGYDTPLSVRVWGDWACFTRPEMKVERVSYPVMTPSAARGILEAIFWKPEFTWRIEEIWVLRPILKRSGERSHLRQRSRVALCFRAGWGLKHAHQYSGHVPCGRCTLL